MSILKVLGHFLLPAVGALALSSPGRAEPEPEPEYGWREVWAGADVSSNVWLLYSGATVAPYGHIFSDGLRLRLSGGYGQYVYTGIRRGEANSFTAQNTYGEALVGYLKRLGPLTAKGFLGIAVIDHQIAPFDPDNPVQGQKVGPKIAAEFWLNVGDASWTSLDLSWTSAHGTAAARLRAGYRVFRDVSLGLEGGINSNDLGEDARAGLFARYTLKHGEVSVSGGFAGRFLDDAQAIRAPYATANWLTQF